MLSCHKLSGEFSRAITVATNDPSNPKVRLFCKGEILEAYKPSPKRLTFSRISRSGPPVVKKVTIARGDGGALDLKLKPLNKQGLSAELRELRPGNAYEIVVTATPPFESDRVFAALRLETGIPEAPVGTISINVTVRPRVETIPRRITVPRTAEPGWEQSARLVWDDGLDHKILSATLEYPGLEAEVREADDGQEVVLRVTEGFQPRSGSGMSSVMIRTDDAEMQIIRLPVSAERSKIRRGTNSKLNRRANVRINPAVSKKATPPASKQPTPVVSPPAEVSKPPVPDKPTTKNDTPAP